MSNQNNKIGALWGDPSDKLTGVVTIDGKETRVVIFKNKFTDNPKAPNYIMYVSNPPVANGSASTPAPQRAAAPQQAATRVTSRPSAAQAGTPAPRPQSRPANVNTVPPQEVDVL